MAAWFIEGMCGQETRYLFFRFFEEEKNPFMPPHVMLPQQPLTPSSDNPTPQPPNPGLP